MPQKLNAESVQKLNPSAEKIKSKKATFKTTNVRTKLDQNDSDMFEGNFKMEKTSRKNAKRGPEN